MLRRLLETDTLKSAVFFGPPGCGKTATARYVAARTQAHTVELNAAAAGVADIKKVLAEAKERARTPTFEERRTLLILDEIHHFNKTQQDVLLPSVERGDIILIGITTENPYFYINTALLSRFSVFEFKPLSNADLRKILLRAAEQVSMTDEAAQYFITQANGDGRKMLNALEIASLTTPPDKHGLKQVDLAIAQECIQKRHLNYDKKGDEHYDVISAFIKSMRGSDPDAACHYLARLLEAGQMPSACRRLMVIAAEDVGLAYPQIIPIVNACVDMALKLGMPEARIPLGDAAVLMATSPKSNSGHIALDAALADVRKGKTGNFPRHLQNVHADSYTMEREQGYLYPHDYPNHWVQQQYLPDELVGTHYYEYAENKLEQAAKQYWQRVKGED